MSLTDPTTTIRTASDAVAAAATLMRQTAQACPQIALRDPHGIWRTYAEMSLASLLYAASSAGCGGGICWAAKALDNTDPELSAEPGWRQVEQLCRGHVPLMAAAARAIDLDDRRRDSMLLALHDVFDYLAGGGSGRPSPLTV
ncbi:MAG TPA: hypothetical protein PLH92_14285 [Mycobacterium sp.]|uniref:hypothetical protein n=1 Tax=Mycolicibacterium sp. TaxID=2320850 RepID=UPI0025ED2833|nr:hypothetical protein [Mycolicibacterium sp.]HPX38503.1 hypothetical protein [Mycobacterium sp.]HQC77874.1 hypothetical protein [Mycobacterium sp.]